MKQIFEVKTYELPARSDQWEWKVGPCRRSECMEMEQKAMELKEHWAPHVMSQVWLQFSLPFEITSAINYRCGPLRRWFSPTLSDTKWEKIYEIVKTEFPYTDLSILTEINSRHFLQSSKFEQGSLGTLLTVGGRHPVVWYARLAICRFNS